jgi:hypothetical protein
MHGYGRYDIRLNGYRFKLLAHRLSFHSHKGEINLGNVVHHKCGVRRCVNPYHLEQVSRAENTRLSHNQDSRRLQIRMIKNCPRYI